MSVAETMIAPQLPPPAPARRFTLSRIAGIVFMAVWLALLVAIVNMVITDFDVAKFDKYGIRMLWGLLLTLKLVATSIVLGAILSLPLAFARMSRSSIISTAASAYIYLFRGTPLIMQVFLIYYGLGSFKSVFDMVGLWWFFRDAYNCALLAFVLNTAAYQAEILRGAIQSVPRGQTEAANALGIHPVPAFFKVIMPQALKISIPGIVSSFIGLFKDTTLVAFVGLQDPLKGITTIVRADINWKGIYWEPYIFAGAIFFIICFGMSRYSMWLERKLKTDHR